MTRSLVAVAGFVLLTVSCARRSSAALTLSGSTSLQPLAEKWVEAYSKSHAGLTIAVQGGGSTAGIHATMTGTAQIGLVSRALTPDERTKVREVVVARDAIAIIVHPQNPLINLRLAELRGLYAGQIASWRALGGPARPVTLITREEGSGTRSAFEALVMPPLRIDSGALVQDSTGAVRQMVAGDIAAIGYISLGLVDTSVKALHLDGVAPTERNIDEAHYALIRPFAFALRGEPSRDVADLIAWVKGPEGASLTRAEGFLPESTGSAHAGR